MAEPRQLKSGADKPSPARAGAGADAEGPVHAEQRKAGGAPGWARSEAEGVGPGRLVLWRGRAAPEDAESRAGAVQPERPEPDNNEGRSG